MRSCFTSLLTIIALIFAAADARAGLTLSLAAESADLSHLSMGQTVRFDVLLSGLASGDSLDYLAGTVTFDSQSLGSATELTSFAQVELGRPQ